MSKILLIVIAFAAGYWLLRSHRRRADHIQQPPDPQAEDMVDCAHCGVHLPRSESIASGSRHFCSAGHEREFHEKR